MTYSGFAQDAYKEEKTKVNSIKRNSNYVYGEGMSSSSEEALTIAETALKSAIYNFISENEELQESDKIVVEAIKQHSEQVKLKRGEMQRVFLYVHKQNIVPNYKSLTIDIPSNTDDIKDNSVQDIVENKTDESNIEITATDIVENVINTTPKLNISILKDNNTVESLGDDQQVNIDSEKNISEINETFISVPKENQDISTDSISITLKTIIETDSASDLHYYMNQKKSAHKLMWGNVKEKIHDNWYLIVLNDDKKIKAVLNKGGDERFDYKNNETVSISQYSKYPKVWFILYE